MFLEHLLKALGIFQKAAADRSDDFANQYLRQIVKEAAEYKKALEVAGLADEAPEQFILARWFEEVDKFSKKELNELGEPFQYKKLIEMINTGFGFEKPNILSKIVPNYSELSGFVHSGPSTQFLLEAHKDDKAKAERLGHVAGMTLLMFCSAKRWLLVLAASARPEFDGTVSEFSAAMAVHL